MKEGQYTLILTAYGWRPHIVLEVGRESVFALDRSTLRVRKFPKAIRHYPSLNVDYKKVKDRLKVALGKRDTSYRNADIEQALEAIEEYLHEKENGSAGADEDDTQSGSVEDAPNAKANLVQRVSPKGKGRRKKARRKAR